MHEMSTCRSLIKQIEKNVDTDKGIVVKKVDVTIGTLSNIDILELQQLFPMASKNTIAEQAKLNITTVFPKINCLHCGTDSVANTRDLQCPVCQSSNTIPLDGTDMILTNIELECDQ